MKTYPMPKDFSGTKFAARYGLDPLKPDFWSDGKLLYVPDNLPDDPPIFEPPDPPAARQTKFTAGVGSRNPAGFIEIGRGKFMPYYD